MSALPRVESMTWERVTREFDDRGPDVCRAEITRELEMNNPELLDMAARCARDLGDSPRVMTGFCLFYRLLTVEARAAVGTSPQATGEQWGPLPRVSPGARESILRRIEAVGSSEFTREVIAELERENPQVLIMWHSFAEDQTDYVGVMQGFALLYACLLAEAALGRSALH